ncbi:hypothetical protein [Kitasatospora aureofaciens]|uniref:hypothetical protein n=1 Tax=Kitasatospora aureofaciens TaxID=1894 RepID=UPI0036F4ABC0
MGRDFTAEERTESVRAMFSQAGAMNRAGRRRAQSAHLNVMTGAALHAAARLGEGRELSELERTLVEMMRCFAGDEEIASWGAIHRKEVTAGNASWLFPASVTDRDMATPYTWQDAAEEVLAAAPQIAAMPNVNVVNVSELGDDRVVDDEAFTAALAEYGGGLTVLTGNPHPDAAGQVQGPLSAVDRSDVQLKWRTRVLMRSFVCKKRAHDSFFDPANEIYWRTSSALDTHGKHVFESQIFGGIEDNSTRMFPANSVLFEGDLRYQVVSHIRVFEEDDSPGAWYNALSDFLRRIATTIEEQIVLLDTTKADWQDMGQFFYGILLAIVRFFDDLISWIRNDDDMVCERTLVWTPEAWLELVKTQLMALEFNGGAQGHHWLYVMADRGYEQSPLEVSWAILDGDRLHHSAPNSWSIGGVTTTALCQDRVVVASGHDIRHFHARGGASAQPMTVTVAAPVTHLAVTPHRTGWVCSDGRAYVSEDQTPLTGVHIADSCARIALSGNRIAVVGANGSLHFKQGPYNATWSTLLPSGAAEVELGSAFLAALKTNGEVCVQIAPTYTPTGWTTLTTGVKQILVPKGNSSIVVVHTDGRCVRYMHDGRQWNSTLLRDNVAHAAGAGVLHAIVDTQGNTFCTTTSGSWTPFGTQGTPIRKIFALLN